jgi:hypothetical protein
VSRHSSVLIRLAGGGALAAVLWIGTAVGAQTSPPPDAAAAAANTDSAAIASANDPAHEAWIDRLIEATEFPATYDALLGAIGAEPELSTEDAPVLRDLAGLARWRNTEAGWRRIFAERLDPATAEQITAYYLDPSGRAINACIQRQRGMAGETACLDGLSAEERETYLRFNASESGWAWASIGQYEVGPVIKLAICDGMERDPALLARAVAMCRRNPGRGACSVLSGLGHGESARIERSACGTGRSEQN